MPRKYEWHSQPFGYGIKHFSPNNQWVIWQWNDGTRHGFTVNRHHVPIHCDGYDRWETRVAARGGDHYVGDDHYMWNDLIGLPKYVREKLAELNGTPYFRQTLS